MGNEYNRRKQQSQNDDGRAQQGALESAEGYLARSASSSRSGDAGGQEFATAFRALLEWGEKEGLIRPADDFTIFGRPPDAAGNEHEAWFDETSNRWFKATYPNRFGLAWDREGSATPTEYITRLVLQNRYFGDDIKLVALVNSGAHLRVLTSQPHIAGEPANTSEIQSWFVSLGFCRLEAKGSIAWYEIGENLLVADAHEGNVIKTMDGVLVPIDLNLVQPSGELREWALKIARSEFMDERQGS